MAKQNRCNDRLCGTKENGENYFCNFHWDVIRGCKPEPIKKKIRIINKKRRKLST